MANPDGIDTSPGPENGGRDHDRDLQIMKATLGNLLLSPKVYLAGIAQHLNTDIDSARDEVNGVLRRLTGGDERIQIGRADSSPSDSEESPQASALVDAVDALPAAATSHTHVSSPFVMPPPADGNSELAVIPDRSTAAPAPAPAPPALVVPLELPCLITQSQYPEGESEIEDADEPDWECEDDDDDDDDDDGKDGEKRTHVSDNGEDEQPPAKRAKKEGAAEETGEEKDDKQTTSGNPTSSSKLHARLVLAADEAMVAKEAKEAAAAAAKEVVALNDTERTIKTALADWLNAVNEPAEETAEEPSSGV